MPPRLRAVLVLAGMVVSMSLAQADVGGDPEAGKAKAAACFGCHGVTGNGGADPTWPKLAGQIPEYLVEQLKLFKTGDRKNPLMNAQAAGLSEQDMKDIAAYFSAQELEPGAATDEELALAGQAIYRGGIREANVPACMSCHGPAGHGIPPRFPRLNGQKPAYTTDELLEFKSGERQDNDDIMTRIASRMTEEQIRAVAEYLAGLHTDPTGTAAVQGQAGR